MSDTTFVVMYNPNLGNVQVDAPLQAVATYQSHGWLLLDPNATPPPIASPYLSQPAADSRYLRDWVGAEVLTAGAVRVAPDGHVIVRVSDGTTRTTYDTTEAALWTALGAANDPALRAAYVTQVVAISGESAAATVTRVNGVLAAASAFGVRKVVKLVGDFTTNAPLVIPSRTVLDTYEATITLATGSNCNLLQNAAVNTVRRVLDAVTTAASTTLTSATAAFVSGDVGKTITVQGAGASGVPLTTTIASVTNGTTAVLAVAASTSVTGQYAALGTRDTGIHVRGGLWDRGANLPNQITGSQVDAHILRFRHVDGLTVDHVTVSSSAVGSKYGINAGDCTDVQIIRPRVGTGGHYSDLVHLNGPVARVAIRDAYGDNMGDDLVSMTARDSTTVITDCAGDITDVVVDGAFKASDLGGGLTACVLKVVAGKTTDGSASYNVKGLRAYALAGNVTTAAAVYIGDSSGGNITDTVIDGVRSLGGSAGVFDTVWLGGGVIDGLILRAVAAHATDRTCIRVSGGVTAGGRLVADNCSIPVGHTVTSLGVVQVDGTMSEIVIDRCSYKGGSGGSLLSLTNGLTPKPSVVSAIIANSHLEVATGGSGAGIVRSQDAGATLTTVKIDNVECANSNYALGFYAGATTIMARNVRSAGASLSSWVRAAAAAALVIYGDGLTGSLDGVNIDAGGTIRCKGFGLPLDVGTTGITKAVGDAAYNTNAARACGVGPVVSDGTSWKGLFTGATF